MDPKKRKLNDFVSSWNECCCCGERGSLGMTNVFNLSLRENETVVKPFAEILEFALGLIVSIRIDRVLYKLIKLCLLLTDSSWSV
jgi:hypothetical protein